MSYEVFERLGPFLIEETLKADMESSLLRARLAPEFMEEEALFLPLEVLRADVSFLLKVFTLEWSQSLRVKRSLDWLEQPLLRLHHPHLPKVLGRRVIEQRQVLLMEDVSGPPLVPHSSYGPQTRPLEEGVALARQLIETLLFLEGHCDEETGRSFPLGAVFPDPRTIVVYKGQLKLLDFVKIGPHALSRLPYCPQVEDTVGFEMAYGERRMLAERHELANVFWVGLLLMQMLAEVDLLRSVIKYGAKKGHQLALADCQARLPSALYEVIEKACSQVLAVFDVLPKARYPDLMALDEALSRWSSNPTDVAEATEATEANASGEAFGWVRERVYDGHVFAVASRLAKLPDLASMPSLTGYIWSHWEERLLAPLREEFPLPAVYHVLLSTLPEATTALLSLLEDEARSLETRLEILSILELSQPIQAIDVLASLLYIEDRNLAGAARKTLSSMPSLPLFGRHQENDAPVLCPHQWETLETWESLSLERYCGRCEAFVVPFETLDALDSSRFMDGFLQLTPLPAHMLADVSVHRQNASYSFGVGQSPLIGREVVPPFGHPSLHVHHAELTWVFGGHIRVRARTGKLFLNGISVTSAFLHRGRRDVLELGDMVLRFEEGELYVCAGEASNVLFYGLPTNASAELSRWDDAHHLPEVESPVMDVLSDGFDELEDSRELSASYSALPHVSASFDEGLYEREIPIPSEPSDDADEPSLLSKLQDVLMGRNKS